MIEEIAGNLAGRLIDPGDRGAVAAGLRQEGALDLPRQFQLPLDPFLFDQGLGLTRVEDGQRRRRRQSRQEMQVVRIEQTVAAPFVDQLDGVGFQLC